MKREILFLGGHLDGQRREIDDDPLPERVGGRDPGYRLRWAEHIVLQRGGSKGCPYVEDADGGMPAHSHPVYVAPDYTGPPRW